MQTLMSFDPLSVSAVPFINQRIKARLTKVNDGDTLTFIISINGYPLKIKMRLAGLDAPETALRKGVSELEKKAGLCVKAHVECMIQMIEIFDITLTALDKYGGRYIGHVYFRPNRTINQALLENHLAKPYDGGTKSQWTDEELLYILSLNHIDYDPRK
jgi:endonuclease YncB( thermonuclease family)